MKTDCIYLDNNATTPCSRTVVEAMLPYMTDVFANTESVHALGRQADRELNNARGAIAEVLAVKPYQLFFSSGATESNNFIFDSYSRFKEARRRVVVGAVEHKSVLRSAEALSDFGFNVTILPVQENGVIDLARARELIDGDVGLVSVQLANNETGAVQPVGELVRIAHSVGAFFHCDAVQALGKMPVDLTGLGIDSASFSAHKIHGPKGVGLLYLKDGSRRFPFPFSILGGEQEQSVRPGTVNLPGVMGMAQAFKELPDEKCLKRMESRRDALELELHKRTDCVVHSQSATRIPNTSNLAFPGIPSDMLMANLPRLCISTGSACNSQELAPSFVLMAMGIGADEAGASIRISLSAQTTDADVECAVDQISAAVAKLKALL